MPDIKPLSCGGFEFNRTTAERDMINREEEIKMYRERIDKLESRVAYLESTLDVLLSFLGVKL